MYLPDLIQNVINDIKTEDDQFEFAMAEIIRKYETFRNHGFEQEANNLRATIIQLYEGLYFGKMEYERGVKVPDDYLNNGEL